MAIKMIRFIGLSRPVFFHGEEPQLNKDKDVQELFLDKITDFPCIQKLMILAYSKVETFLSRAQLAARRGHLCPPSVSVRFLEIFRKFYGGRFFQRVVTIARLGGAKMIICSSPNRRPLLKNFEIPLSESVPEKDGGGSSAVWVRLLETVRIRPASASVPGRSSLSRNPCS